LLQASGVGGLARAGSNPARPDPLALGYEIFNREWMPNDPRGHGGDGLGPVYNDTSCVACHNSGGSGGAGPVSKNIDILNALRSLAFNGNPMPSAPEPRPVPTRAVPGESASSPSPAAAPNQLAEFHSGFRTSRTVVLHKFGTDPNYDSWRSERLHQSAPQRVEFPNGGETVVTVEVAPPAVAMPSPPGAPMPKPVATHGRGVDQIFDGRAEVRIGQIRASLSAAQPQQAVGAFVVTRSQRNPTPLFGLGLIDAIPEATIEAIAKHQAKESPEIQGRVSRLKDFRIGRLGWKGQTANAEDFVLNACAVEVGLEVPGHAQAMIPQAPRYKPPGLDLTSEECAALVAYVRSLPRPVERPSSHVEEANFLGAGKATFANIGCAGCHTPSLGKVEGIYSDLLLHDMGPEMADSGSYGDSSDDGSNEPLVPLLADGQPSPAQPRLDSPQARRGASRQEWRTPPLWCFRDSGPYLHDGRAQTLEQAVAVHGGQGAASAKRFLQLSPRDRLQVEAFLKSLVAPASNLIARAGD
jgi:CxxC motif-containing protein (DUF1111 family)